MYLNEIEKEEGNAQNRFNLPLNKRIKSRLNNVEKKTKKKELYPKGESSDNDCKSDRSSSQKKFKKRVALNNKCFICLI